MSRTYKLRDFEKFVILKSKPLEKVRYADRYGGDPKKYRKQCARAHQKTDGLCCVCMTRPSDQLHHSSYRKSGDRIGVNCFPTCSICHIHICHHNNNWIVHPTDPVWKNHNTASFTKMLQQNFKRLQARRLN